MIWKNRLCLFGFWDGMPYRSITDKYEDFEKFTNQIEKQKVIRHIEGLDYGLSPTYSVDLFTGERFHAGIYEDGHFRFPIDFLRYYKSRNIGIPYEYEDYLMDILE